MSRKHHYDLVVFARQPRTLGQIAAVSALVRANRRLRPYRLRDPDPLPVGGHYAVTRSLIAGLQEIGADFAYEPNLERCSARAAIVLASAISLERARQWKRGGHCDLLLAGPNIVDDPAQLGQVIASPDLIPVVASDKMRLIFEAKCRSIKGRVKVWPAGVDARYWQRSGQPARDTLLIYNKRMPKLAAELYQRLSQSGIRTEIIHYGDKRPEKYRPHQFRAALDRSYACVFLTYSEPQGLAASEAWSMDVPTFVYRVEELAGQAIVPYLTDSTGAYWSCFEELAALVKALSPGAYAPRQWVLDNMTDAVCARRLLEMSREPERARLAG